jgi:hypothetical protein
MGAVFLVATTASHASACRFRYTALNVGAGKTIGEVGRNVRDVAGGTSCSGEKSLWLPWPCVDSDTTVRFELYLVARSRQVDSALTDKFLQGGGC